MSRKVVDRLWQHLAHRRDNLIGRVASQKASLAARCQRTAAYHAQRVRFGQQIAHGSGCSRTAQRGLRQIIALTLPPR